MATAKKKTAKKKTAKKSKPISTQPVPTKKGAQNKAARVEAFCQQRMVFGTTLTDAYMKAYPTSTRWARNTLWKEASLFAKDPMVVERMDQLREEQRSAFHYDLARLDQETISIALSDVREIVDENGNLKNIEDIPEHTRRAISGVDITEEFAGKGDDREKVGYTKKVKVFDKLKALELLYKREGALTEKREHTGKDGGPIEIDEETSTLETARRILWIIKQAGEKGDEG